MGRRVAASANEGDAPLHPGHEPHETGQPLGADAGPYGGDFAPPGWMEPDHLDAMTVPPPPSTEPVRQIEMTVTGQKIEVANGSTVDAWTYQGSVPGPTIRATEGETIRIRFRNLTGHDHNLHFHGSHSPLHDGWEPVPPGR